MPPDSPVHRASLFLKDAELYRLTQGLEQMASSTVALSAVASALGRNEVRLAESLGAGGRATSQPALQVLGSKLAAVAAARDEQLGACHRYFTAAQETNLGGAAGVLQSGAERLYKATRAYEEALLVHGRLGAQMQPQMQEAKLQKELARFDYDQALDIGNSQMQLATLSAVSSLFQSTLAFYSEALAQMQQALPAMDAMRQRVAKQKQRHAADGAVAAARREALVAELRAVTASADAPAPELSAAPGGPAQGFLFVGVERHGGEESADLETAAANSLWRVAHCTLTKSQFSIVPEWMDVATARARARSSALSQGQALTAEQPSDQFDLSQLTAERAELRSRHCVVLRRREPAGLAGFSPKKLFGPRLAACTLLQAESAAARDAWLARLSAAIEAQTAEASAEQSVEDLAKLMQDEDAAASRSQVSSQSATDAAQLQSQVSLPPMALEIHSPQSRTAERYNAKNLFGWASPSSAKAPPPAPPRAPKPEPEPTLTMADCELEIAEPVRQSVILDAPRILALHSMLPPLNRFSKWKLLYSTAMHGISMETFARRTKVRGCDSSVLVLQDANGDIFGGYAGRPWKRCDEFYGNGTSFLWRFEHGSDHAQQYGWAGTNDCFQMSTAQHIAMGGADAYGLVLEADLTTGSSSACETFGNPPLCEAAAVSELGDFRCRQLEVWGMSD